MKNTLNIDLLGKTIVITKTFEKKANVYGSSEYELLSDVIAKHPDFKIEIRTITKHENKVSYKNLTYSNMVAYMKEQPNASELLAEFERQKRMSAIAKNKYRYIVNWFKSTCFANDADFSVFRDTVALPTVDLETTETKAENFA